MLKDIRLMKAFFEVASVINSTFGMSPLLYGSLGLQKVLGIDLSPMDIDVLVPEELIGSRWMELVELMNNLGYELTDLHEHEFTKIDTKIAFAIFEDLVPFAGIDLSSLKTIKEGTTEYKLLNLEQYLAVYQKSLLDSYRKNKNNNKDKSKIELIELALRAYKMK
jgi:hypothetical protein